MLFRKKDIIGIDIGSSSIKLVELKERKGVYELLNFGMIPLPPEAIVDGSIMDSLTVVEGIKGLISGLKIRTKNVATSISGHAIIIKRISLPVMSKEELEESINWEAEQYIPFDINDVNIDFQILGESEDPHHMDVLLVAVKKDVITDYTTIMSEAGLSPLILDIDSLALGNMFEINYPDEVKNLVALVNIGASIMNINIMKNAIPLFTRDISIGGNQFTEEIQKHFYISYEEAEKMKIGIKEDNEKKDEIDRIIGKVSNSIAVEVQKSLDFYAASSPEKSITKIYLSGGGAKLKEIDEVIRERVGIDVERINPFKNINYIDKGFESEYIENIAPFAAVAVGLALRRIGDKI
jgi:type IV pilus assembly protein PilM